MQDNKNNYKKILVTDIINFKNPDYNDLIKRLPFWICKETQEQYGKKKFQSFYIIAITKTSFIVQKDYIYYDEEPDWGDGETHIDSFKELKFIDIDDTYILANEATENQKDWLEKHKYNPDICGYHAWNIIHEEIETAKKRSKESIKYKSNYHNDVDEDWDCSDHYF